MNIVDKIAEDPSGVTVILAAAVIIPAAAAAWFLTHRKQRWLAIYRYAATVDEKNYEAFMEEARAAAAVLARA